MQTNKTAEASALPQLLPYWKFEQNYLLHVDGSVTAGLELQGRSLECLSPEMLEQYQQQLVLFFHSLPQHVEFQLLYQVRPSSPVLDRFSRETAQFVRQEYRFLWENSATYLREHTALWHTKLYLFMTLPAPQKQNLPTWQRISSSLRSISAQHVHQQSANWMRERAGRVHALVEHIKMSLAVTDLRFRELTQVDLSKLLYEALNPVRSNSLPLHLEQPYQYLREAVTFSTLQRFPREFILDDLIHRVLSLKSLPQHQSPISMFPLLSLREVPFNLCLGFQVDAPEKIMRELKRARNIQANLMAGKQHDEIAEREYSTLQDIIQQLVQGDAKAFQVTYQVHYWGKNEEELQKTELLLRQTFHQCSEAQEVREEFSYPEVFLSMLPGGLRLIKKKRSIPTITPQALSLLPLYQKNKGANRPVVIVKNRLDEVVGLDPFDAKLAASNAIIFGPTGRGKSFLAQYLLLHYFRLQPKIIIVDIGGSYRRLTKLLGGEYITLQGDGKVSLNPFLAVTGELDSALLGDLSGIVERMVKDEGAAHLDRVTQYLIRQAIQLLYQKHPHDLHFRGLRSCFLDLAKEAADVEDQRKCRDLAKRLSLWIEGEGAALLSGSQPLSFDVPVTTIDLAGVPAAGDLQAVVMHVLASRIRAFVARNHGPKIILFDEVWRHLGDPTAARVLDELYRTARKHFASVISISQKLEDFLNPLIQTSIVHNSDTRFLLKTVEELPRLKEVFKLNENELELVKTLTMRRGYFAETFAMIGEDHEVLRIESTPWIYWMCTTHPPEMDIERFLKEQRPQWDDLQVIQWLAKHYPFGVESDDLESVKQNILKELA